MPPKKNTKRAKAPSALDRRGKKKVSILTQEKIEYVDWKDVNLLRRFTSDRAKIRARRVTCLLYTSPSPRDGLLYRMPSSA